VSSLALRVLKGLGESPFWRWTGRLHAAVYRLTGGRVGHAAGHLTNLLLTTTGRRSGVSRTIPLAYVMDGPNYVVVASNGGADRHPAWWLNLQHAPAATVQVRDRTVAVRARRADLRERARLWPQLKAINPFFARYEQITAREIPVVILEPMR
jgi:deazaflavin-dependent oxidoreductase (nitroreductase family)